MLYSATVLYTLSFTTPQRMSCKYHRRLFSLLSALTQRTTFFTIWILIASSTVYGQSNIISNPPIALRILARICKFPILAYALSHFICAHPIGVPQQTRTGTRDFPSLPFSLTHTPSLHTLSLSSLYLSPPPPPSTHSPFSLTPPVFRCFSVGESRSVTPSTKKPYSLDIGSRILHSALDSGHSFFYQLGLFFFTLFYFSHSFLLRVSIRFFFPFGCCCLCG